MGIKFEKNGYYLRLAKIEDAEKYYIQNYISFDKFVLEMTNSKEHFEKKEVVNFFKKSVEADDRVYFLLVDKDDNIVGESVIMDIDNEVKSAHLRLAIFKQNARGKGLGSFIVEKTRDFAFEKLNLNRLELEVYSFNVNAKKLYEKAGFLEEGILRENVIYKDELRDTILMSILRREWEKLKKEKA